MLTNKFYSVIKPFFMSRGNGVLTTNDMLDNVVNIAIQDIYSNYDWVFKNKAEELTSEPHTEGFKIWATKYPIDRVIRIEDENGRVLNPTSGHLPKEERDRFEDPDCTVGSKHIITRDSVESVVIEYIMDYEWYNYSDQKNRELPVPNKFIPPLINLIYDVASPVSYFEDDEVVPRYQIGARQLNALQSTDGISADTYFAPDRST